MYIKSFSSHYNPIRQLLFCPFLPIKKTEAQWDGVEPKQVVEAGFKPSSRAPRVCAVNHCNTLGAFSSEIELQNNNNKMYKIIKVPIFTRYNQLFFLIPLLLQVATPFFSLVLFQNLSRIWLFSNLHNLTVSIPLIFTWENLSPINPFSPIFIDLSFTVF